MADRFLVDFSGLDTMSEKEKRKKFSGLDIVMAGFAGLNGSVTLAREKYDLLSSRYPARFLEETGKQERFLRQIPGSISPGGADGVCTFPKKGIAAVYLLAEGGVFAGLWNMGKRACVGLEVYLKQIPIKQETVEICHFFDVNPYQIQSEGSCLFLSENGGRWKGRLREEGIFSEVIGVTTEKNDRVVINGGEKRYLQKNYPDALASIIKTDDRTLRERSYANKK